MKAYQLKITIKDTHPPIWRRVIVPAGLSFNQLSLVLNTVMGWCGYHLSSFTFQALNLEFEDNPENDFSMWSNNEILDSAEYIIDDYIEAVKSFTYVYDFGDYWRHQVQVEKIIKDYDHNYPQVIKFKGGCPLEDCGGVWGYERLISILNDPEDEEYENMMEWSGGRPDSEYDMDEVNDYLAQMELTDEISDPLSKEEVYENYWQGQPFKKIDPENDAEDPDKEQVQEIASVVTDLTLINVIECLKKNTLMKEEEIIKALEIDDEYYEFLKALMEED